MAETRFTCTMENPYTAEKAVANIIHPLVTLRPKDSNQQENV